MKKIVIILMLISLLHSVAVADQLYWFCAAAVKKPSLKIVKLYNKTHKNRVFLIAGGTGQILQQMILSKKGDIYTSMDTKFFNQAKNKGIITKYTEFLKLIPVFGLSKIGEKKIHRFMDIFNPGIKIAGGNSKTMALGKTYSLILKKLPKKLSLKLKKNTVVYAINISQIINYLRMSNVDAGIVFKAVAKMNNLRFILIPKKYNQIKTGYVAEVIYGKNKKAKAQLYRFILNHLYIYKQYGFTLLNP